MSVGMVDTLPRWRRRLRDARRDPWGVVMRAVGDRTAGLGGPPLNWYSRRHQTDRYRELVMSAGDDGRGLELRAIYRENGRIDEMVAGSLGGSEVLWLTRNLVHMRIVDWFGLRRRLYFHALTRHLEATAPGRIR